MMDKNQLIKEIVEMEWQQFQNVHNEGGRDYEKQPVPCVE